MSKDTSIQWCDSSVNPTMGCDGCELWSRSRRTCYAGQLHRRYGGRPGYAPKFEHVTMFSGRTLEAAKWSDLTGTERPEKPWLNGMPRCIFLFDMSDGLSKAVTFEYLKKEVIDVAGSQALGGRRHIWMWPTKRPSRMAAFSRWLLDEHGVAWPANVWPMTSVTNQFTVARIEQLCRVGDDTTTRGVSFEPLDEAITLPLDPAIHWAVLGGESEQAGADGTSRPCRESDLVSLAEQLVMLGVPYFVKQMGSRFVGLSVLGRIASGVPKEPAAAPRRRLENHHGGDWSEWDGINPLLRVRTMPAWPKGAMA